MFVCRACLRKGLAPGALARINAPAVGSRLALPRLGALTPSQSTTTIRSYHLPALKPKTAADPSVTLDLEAPEGEEDGDGSEGKRKKRDLSDEQRKKLERSAALQLKHFKDPFHIEKQVKLTLDKGKYEEALVLTRKASKNAKVQVSWNHLIDYHMKNKRLSAAIKIYNEMKKRAQVPDARTYTIIFRGCAMSEHPKQAVAEAVKIYHSLLRNERVKPTTIHLNAVLETCARAGDLDSMFTTVQTANESTRKPDNLTYTIIFNALRAQFNPRLPLDRDPMQRDQEDINREKQEAINRGLQIWEDVQRQWKKANLMIDEELVCSFGRLLTLGTKEDNERVFELLSSSMQLPRFHAGEKAAAQVTAKAVDITTTPVVSSEAASPEATASEAPETTPTKTTTSGSTTPTVQPIETKPKFDKKPKSVTHSPSLYAKPGNNTLSLILSVLSNTRRTSLAQKYWDLLTSTPYSIKPDKDNYFRYLRVLQIGRGSAATAAVLQSMPAEFITPMILKTAFTTCIRDELNPHAFSPHACTIFDVMTKKTRYPDAIAMRLFLQSAQGNFRHIKKMAETDPLGSRQAMGKQIILALDKMWQPYRIMVNQYSYPIGSRVQAQSPEDAWKAVRAHMSECVVTARRMISAMDKVMLNSMCADDEILKVLKRRRVILQNMVERYVAKDGDMMGRWREKMVERYGEAGLKKREAEKKGASNAGEEYEFGQPKPNEFERNLNKKKEEAVAANEKRKAEQAQRPKEAEEENEEDEEEEEWEDITESRYPRDKTRSLRNELRRDEKSSSKYGYQQTSNNSSSWSRESQGGKWDRDSQQDRWGSSGRKPSW
ncbi:hypothetical protein NCU07871 [Neurospora crassa OR74A]|uniref:Pentatricopeptide repeat protein n=1 Tax=Neurospora crassa (strain ATCC 24698 / 74-OR23-1A / CBS 708.71 / DSM 1257 / FGSC 987) TaxID=367110 RepID=Q7SBT8_NEUCR|nr:hypothetical protein NCU07871 [Neurospora crassa OR74A]EAA33896.1 hypothetical protein NCU07871 [Neurospora crassa OR74A]|eukprot:XP_963132.1 hypothetical protein NCU07871 [Neurospora crassa OR74A]